MHDRAFLILLVDDDIDFLAINRALLERSGYEVITATTGSDGFEQARIARPDLVVLDVMMEDATEGFDTAKRLRGDIELKHIPIILLTSVNRQFRPLSFAPDPEWLPVDRLLDKPVDAARLLGEIASLLRRSEG